MPISERSSMNPDALVRYQTMIEIAHQAGEIALSYFDTGIKVEEKEDLSPVTIADRETESFLREQILKSYPSDGMLGEEYGEENGSSGYRWIIDPIDGTRSYIRNIPIWATLVSLEFEGKPIAGVCHMPVLQQTFHALRGNGSYRNERKLSVSKTNSLKSAIFSYSSYRFFKDGGRKDVFLRLIEETDRPRGYSDFWGFMLLAQGSVDLVVEMGVHIWDIAGLKVIVEEAGGKFSTWEGDDRIDLPDVMATNGILHDEVLSYLRT
jgi:histidinol-phosphatase